MTRFSALLSSVIVGLAVSSLVDAAAISPRASLQKRNDDDNKNKGQYYIPMSTNLLAPPANVQAGSTVNIGFSQPNVGYDVYGYARQDTLYLLDPSGKEVLNKQLTTTDFSNTKDCATTKMTLDAMTSSVTLPVAGVYTLRLNTTFGVPQSWGNGGEQDKKNDDWDRRDLHNLARYGVVSKRGYGKKRPCVKGPFDLKEASASTTFTVTEAGTGTATTTTTVETQRVDYNGISATGANTALNSNKPSSGFVQKSSFVVVSALACTVVGALML